MSARSFVRVGLTAFTLFTAALSTPAALARQPEGDKPVAAAEGAPKRDASALKAIEAMGKFYRELKQYTVKIDADMGEAPMEKGRIKVGATLALDQPNRLKATSTAMDQGPMSMGPGLVVSDGKKVLYSGVMNKQKMHVEEDAPESIEEITQNPNYVFSMGAGMAIAGLPLMLGSEEGLEELLTEDNGITDAGVTTVDGVEVRKIVFTIEGGEGEGVLLIQTGDKPWLRELSFKQIVEEGEKGQTMEMKFSEWSDSKPADDVFTLKVPDGSKSVKSFMEGMGMGGDEGGPGTGGHDQEHELIGKDAPAFNLPVVGSENAKIDLASFKGKNIVVVDFWASWCGPCVQSMPKVVRVAEEFKDKGVVFFGLNVDEDADEIQAFMKKKSWTFTALLGKGSDVSETYSAEAIPQTVIIDKEGKVRQVHVGFGPGGEKTLKKELEALLEGKDPLALEKKEEAKTEEKKDDGMGGDK